MATGNLIEESPLEIVAAEQVEQLSLAMNCNGVGVLRNVVSESTLEWARNFVNERLEENEGRYFSLRGHEWMENSPPDSVFHTQAFRDVMKGLYEHAMGSAPPSDRVVSVLRVLAGTLGLRHSNLFHYDSYVVTALVPIMIPSKTREPSGQLVMFPNLRNVRRNSIVNILEKAVVESSFARRMWRKPWVQNLFGARIVLLEPGNIYFFWGMRSLHANEACQPERVRSTALFHFGDPHEKSIFKRMSQRRAAAFARRLEKRAA